MDDMLRGLVETPTAPGHERVIYPGLPESEEIENHDGSLDLLYREMQCDITYPVTFLRYTLLIMKPCLPRLKHWVPD